MAWQSNFHSRLVAWMKIILPLAALGLLSTLFLISRNFDPTKSIPVAEIDLEQRAHDLGATNATFAGVTSGGDEVTMAAETARPSRDDTRRIEAEIVTAELRLVSGGVIDISADRADMHQSEYTAVLDGHVDVSTTTGYRIRTERLNTRFDVLFAESPGPIWGDGPPGDLEAGRMVLTSDAETGDAHLLFTDGVKLVYKPQVSEE
jgi:lipopolysaccharide export system protein LptC